ncbi:sugar phosphate isomerase/epimerase [Nocardia sp. BMG111209]|uniref:sugar phosphate isomerase/epimerase family protein n=1 Tax=Nocardia sp. BMG111209 TaxID=1160137 RepID=UPI00036563D9|nr:TIM barrel protein [Nocardia sp. BMG111209]
MTLSVFQSLWAMEDLPLHGARWTVPQRVERVAEAGFDGVGIDTYTPGKNPPAATMARLLDAAGLRSSVTVFVTEQRPLSEGLRYATDVGAELVVVCGEVFPDSVAAAAELVADWMEQSRRAGVAMQLETHRYTLTNDPAFTAQLVQAVDVPLALDLSHYVVGSELPDPDAGGAERPRVQRLLDILYERAGSVQGRVATREQIQVPLHWPPHRRAERRFETWWTDAFRSLHRRRPDQDCVFLCELGPYPYALVGPDGRELSDRWAESLDLAARARTLFAAAADHSRATAR